MNQKFPVSGKITVLFVALMLVAFTSCNRGGSNQNGRSSSDTSQDFEAGTDNETRDKINTAKRIFYSLPSPLETAMLIKNAGATYNEALLNPTDNSSRYITNKSMALNLGIFTTDLSFASLFDQTQATLSYIEAAKKMADGLNILDAIDEATIQRLEENINNRDVIIDIISETLLNSSSYLKDKGLESTASIILVGGWVEGLYIATNLVGSAKLTDNKLVERIVDQKLSLEIIIKLLEESPEDPDAQLILKDVLVLNDIYKKVTIKQGEITAVEDPETNVTTLKSDSEIHISPEVFKELAAKVKEIRTSYIS